MTLAQVVHKISKDSSFASEWQKDPEAALASSGLELSREEIAFLSKGLKRSDGQTVRLPDVSVVSGSWRD